MKKILNDDAYKKQFMNWVNYNLFGVELEISSKLPRPDGFIPVKGWWVSERTFGGLNFFRRLDKDTESWEAWLLWQNCKVVLNRLAPDTEENF